MLKRNLLCVVLVLCISTISQAAIIVAASNSLPEEKAKADIVCDGKDDQVELLASITKANKFDVLLIKTPGHSRLSSVTVGMLLNGFPAIIISAKR